MITTDNTAGAVMAETETIEPEIGKDIYSLSRKWVNSGRPYTEKEVALFKSFSFEAGPLDLFAKNIGEIEDPVINDFILLSVVHCGGQRTKEICEAICRSKKYQTRYPETLIWLLKRISETNVDNIRMRMRIWFAIELCPLEALISFLDKNDLPNYIKEKFILYSLPGQTWQLAREIWNSVDDNTSYGRALCEVMREFDFL